MVLILTETGFQLVSVMLSCFFGWYTIAFPGIKGEKE